MGNTAPAQGANETIINKPSTTCGGYIKLCKNGKEYLMKDPSECKISAEFIEGCPADCAENAGGGVQEFKVEGDNITLVTVNGDTFNISKEQLQELLGAHIEVVDYKVEGNNLVIVESNGDEHSLPLDSLINLVQVTDFTYDPKTDILKIVESNGDEHSVLLRPCLDYADIPSLLTAMKDGKLKRHCHYTVNGSNSYGKLKFTKATFLATAEDQLSPTVYLNGDKQYTAIFNYDAQAFHQVTDDDGNTVVGKDTIELFPWNATTWKNNKVVNSLLLPSNQLVVENCTIVGGKFDCRQATGSVKNMHSFGSTVTMYRSECAIKNIKFENSQFNGNLSKLKMEDSLIQTGCNIQTKGAYFEITKSKISTETWMTLRNNSSMRIISSNIYALEHYFDEEGVKSIFKGVSSGNWAIMHQKAGGQQQLFRCRLDGGSVTTLKGKVTILNTSFLVGAQTNIDNAGNDTRIENCNTGGIQYKSAVGGDKIKYVTGGGVLTMKDNLKPVTVQYASLDVNSVLKVNKTKEGATIQDTTVESGAWLEIEKAAKPISFRYNTVMSGAYWKPNLTAITAVTSVKHGVVYGNGNTTVTDYPTIGTLNKNW
jgi:hypothetical protein